MNGIILTFCRIHSCCCVYKLFIFPHCCVVFGCMKFRYTFYTWWTFVCFQFGASMNTAAKNTLVHVFGGWSMSCWLRLTNCPWNWSSQSLAQERILYCPCQMVLKYIEGMVQKYSWPLNNMGLYHVGPLIRRFSFNSKYYSTMSSAVVWSVDGWSLGCRTVDMEEPL